jgi:hypothetical protein
MIAQALLTAAVVVALQTASPNVYRSLERGTPVHNAGALHAVIVSVNYADPSLTVRRHGMLRGVTIVPNTSIFRGGRPEGFSDLRPGMRVVIAAYQVSGRLVAQSIRIAP